jgi:lysozyme family protein
VGGRLRQRSERRGRRNEFRNLEIFLSQSRHCQFVTRRRNRIYKSDFWDKHPFGGLYSQKIANKFFDMSVNMGAHQATKLVQEACVDCGKSVTVDGSFGLGTLMAVNTVTESAMLFAIRNRCELFYNGLVKLHPQNAKFLRGWLNRARAGTE